jgi:hypothetical protein
MLGPFKIDLTKPRNWREDASNADAWARWDREWRKRLGWRAGLAFWCRTNVPKSRVLLSRHWPHRLCWSWSIWVGIVRPAYDGKRTLSIVALRRYRSFDIRLWWFKASFHWQNSDHMVALGPYREGAPKIYWKHHLERAEPAGSA